MNDTALSTEIWTAAIEVAKVLAKGSLTAGTVTALAWFTCEWILFPLRTLSEAAKRQATLAVGMALVFLAHGTDLVSFGSGPKGWGIALFFGFVGGGLAPALHDQIKGRVPVLTKAGPANGA